MRSRQRPSPTKVGLVDAFSIAFICTGNRFRSVLAQAFVRRLTEGLPVTTESFGTLELDGAPPLAEAIELGRACGVDVTGYVTRCVSRASLSEVDLVVGFEATHVRHAVVDAGAARERSFTMRELVRFLEEGAVTPQDDDIVEKARKAVRATAAAHTGQRLSDETPDPLGASWNVYRDTAAEVRDLSLRLVKALFDVSDPSALPELPEKAARRALLWRR
jgi:protein-tyrosine-phosphatase